MVRMRRRIDDDDDDDNNNNNNNVWLHGRGKPMSDPTSSHQSPPISECARPLQSRSNTGSQVKHLPLPIVARHSGSSRLVVRYRLVAVHGSRALA